MAENSDPKWHIASWIVPSIIAIAVLLGTVLAVLEGFEMATVLWIISIAGVLVLVLLCVVTLPLWMKVAGSVLITTLCAYGICWDVKFNRPIFPPDIGGLITQRSNGNAFAMDVQATIRNDGHQSGYADRWQLVVYLDESELQAIQLHGQPLPSSAANEPEISDEEFVPGKSVRGWLFFAFPGVQYDFVMPYFTCGSPLMSKVRLKLSVWDSKNKHEWSQTRVLKELGDASCYRAPVATQTVPVHPKAVAQAKPKAKSTSPTPATSSTPTNNCQNGICISGGTVYDPVVNNNYGGLPIPKVVGLQEEVLPAVAPFAIPPGENRLQAAMHYNGLLGAEKGYLYRLGNPDGGMPVGLRVTFSVDSSFVNPQFTIVCDKPCFTTSVLTGQTDGMNIVESSGMPSVLIPGRYVVLTVRSKGEPITHADVYPTPPATRE